MICMLSSLHELCQLRRQRQSLDYRAKVQKKPSETTLNDLISDTKCLLKRHTDLNSVSHKIQTGQALIEFQRLIWRAIE